MKNLKTMFTGYVETETAYLEYSRPPQPSTTHVWINGELQYSQQNHIYVQENGYWEKPSHRHTRVTAIGIQVRMFLFGYQVIILEIAVKQT